MSDREVVALAAIAWLGAVVGWRTGIGPGAAVGAVAAVVALLLKRPPLLLLAIALLTSGRAAADARGLADPPVGPVSGWATLVDDPTPVATGAVQVELRIGGRHVLATARGAPAASLQRLAAGEQAMVDGRLSRAPPGTDWLAVRHIATQLTVTAVNRDAPGSLVVQTANALRDLLERSAGALPEEQRSLYLGFVLGDDRGQPPAIVDDFRGSGLSHLLVVSGENVAFVLVLVAPMLRRLGLRSRWLATVGVISFFALVTRFEPSVLRASVMAGLAATAVMLGREASGMRMLALAVAGLLVVDPFLVGAVGFQLSVAASAAILLLSRPIAARLPGPRFVADAVGVSVAAQVGVAPLLVATFGSAPVGSLAANVLAAPAAGPVMVWGVAAGLVGGAGGAAAATVLHLPTRMLIAWIALVAHRVARWPLGQVGWCELAALAVGVTAVAVGSRWPRPALRVGGIALVALGLLAPSLHAAAEPPFTTMLDGGEVWRAGSGALLVVGTRAKAGDLLAGLREAGVGHLDLVVLTRPGQRAIADAVAADVPVGGVVAPGAIETAVIASIGSMVVTIEPDDDGLTVTVAPVGGRDPPV